MKFYECSVVNHWHSFSYKSRTLFDLFLLHKTCEYFRPKKILEIGFAQGKTLSTLVDSSLCDTKFTTIDKTFEDGKYFCKLHSNSLDRIKFVEMNSIEFQYTDVYDLILVDGDHSYETVKLDIKNSVNSLSKLGILAIDDVLETHPGVVKAVSEFLVENKDWVPFMKGNQTLWVHHISHDASFFLDNFLPDCAEKFASFYNCKQFNNTVLTPETFDIFNEEISVAKLICKTLDI